MVDQGGEREEADCTDRLWGGKLGLERMRIAAHPVEEETARESRRPARVTRNLELRDDPQLRIQNVERRREPKVLGRIEHIRDSFYHSLPCGA